MSRMNIAGVIPVDDPSYRYQMPRLQAKVEGRGNGIKTLIVNVTDIGLALNRDAPEICKFFGTELGSLTNFSTDKGVDRALVNGNHTAQDLQALLCRYIENFVLCKQCRLPETSYKIKAGLISQKCAACGNKDNVDMTHKLTTFILAQHKRNKELAAKNGEKKDKKDKKDKKENADEGAADDNEKEVKKKKKDKKDKSDDSLKKSPKSRSADATDEFAETEENGDDETDSKATEDSIERIKSWMVEHGDATHQQILEEIRSIQTLASLPPACRIIIYLGTAFTENIISAKEIAKNKAILALLAASNIQQRQLISSFEWFCGTRYPQLQKYFPVILKNLFDEELIEEDVFFEWSSDTVRNEYSVDESMITYETLEQLKQSAAPFIKWLAEAEEEGDDDDDDDDDDGEDDDDDDDA